MQPILAVTVPFFSLVVCGWLAARSGVLPSSAVPGLNAFVLYFALPCMLFRFGAATPLAELLNPALLGVYLAAAVLVVGAALVATPRRVPPRDAAFGALVAAFPNTGFMGVPLLVALLGPTAAGPVICAVLADLLFTSSLCIGIAQSRAGADPANAAARSGAPAAAMRALRGALSNPLAWAIAAGAVFSVSGTALPGPAATAVGMLGDAASPVALFTIGAVLWRSGGHAQQPARVGELLPPVLIKLVLHPLLVALLARGAIAAGAGLTPFQATVLTLAAALPSASNVALLAERYGADDGRIARIVMASTVLAFGSFSALAWWLAG